jgi:hypothetical protein
LTMHLITPKYINLFEICPNIYCMLAQLKKAIRKKDRLIINK